VLTHPVPNRSLASIEEGGDCGQAISSDHGKQELGADTVVGIANIDVTLGQHGGNQSLREIVGNVWSIARCYQ